MLSVHIDTGKTWRGGQSQIMHTVIGLREIGHKAVLVAPADGELWRRMREGMDLVPLSPRSDVDLAAAWRLSRVLKQIRPDVIHAHDPRAVAVAATALSIWSPTPKPPLVAARRLWFRMALNSFSRWKYSQVDCFIANCAAVQDRLVADGVPRRKTLVIHEGVDVHRIERLAPADVHGEFYMPHGSPVVGSVAALVPHKGQRHLIDAAALVVRDVPDARFVIVGDGELRESLEKHIHDKHLERHVFLAGWRADALEMTRAFDLFVMSSLHEGMCTALADAMAAGRACVGTRVGGIPVVIVDGETGYVVPPRDHQAMAERLVFLLRHEAIRQRMGEAGRQRAHARFTVERMVADTAGVYEDLVRSRATTLRL
jgi:glycosyltransferase involved in cell wall biosynthesis